MQTKEHLALPKHNCPLVLWGRPLVPDNPGQEEYVGGAEGRVAGDDGELEGVAVVVVLGEEGRRGVSFSHRGAIVGVGVFHRTVGWYTSDDFTMGKQAFKVVVMAKKT